MKKENQPKQRKRWKKVLLIILCIVLVLLLAGFLILRSIFMQPSIPAATGDDAQRTSSGARRLAASRWSDGLCLTLTTEKTCNCE